jgi:hypothetical protein
MPENVGDARPSHHADLAVVYVASGEMEALTVKSVLEGAGIEATLKMEAVTKLLAMTIDGLGAVEVLVPAERLDEARAILDTPAEVVEDPDESASDGGNS